MGRKRILIIDDDLELGEEMVELFEGEGYEATCTSDPREGIAIIKKDCHDIVLLDYKMRELSGVDILKSIENKKLSARIFIVSGRPFVENLIKEEGLSEMVAAVIPKPINFENLFEKISSICGRGGKKSDKNGI